MKDLSFIPFQTVDKPIQSKSDSHGESARGDGNPLSRYNLCKNLSTLCRQLETGYERLIFHSPFCYMASISLMLYSLPVTRKVFPLWQ